MLKYKLIVFDIDGTIVKHISSWQYIHEKLKIWDNLACKYQQDFLSGKISYKRFCELDANHWKGLNEENIISIMKKVPYSKNAFFYIKKLKKQGFKLAAISTGLQYIAERVEKDLEFDYVVSNRLISKNNILTGKVKINVVYDSKGPVLKKILKKSKIPGKQIICIGDSAGDIPMAKIAGYSIAFNSSNDDFSAAVDYNCKTKDFKEVFQKIMSVSKRQKDF